MALRVCGVCGLEAKNEDDLALFVKNPRCEHGRSNRCKQCSRDYCKNWRKRNTEHMKDYYKNWRLRNLEHLKEYDDERGNRVASFKGRLIRLKENPRTNICSVCGKSYPKELKQQTSLHHIIYDEVNPMAYTIELCNSCHQKLHHA